MNSFQILTLIGIIFYTLSLSFSIYINFPRRIGDIFEFKNILILSFLLIFSVYVYPLALFYFSGDVVSGDISPDVYGFGTYIPFSLFLASIFIVLLSILFKKWNYNFDVGSSISKPLSKIDVSILALLFVICIYLLIELGKSVGGVAMLILKGYSVTELFIGKGQYAVAFEWISTIVLLFFSNSLLRKSKFYIGLSVSILLFLIMAFSVMGRRAAVVVLLGSAIMCYNLLYARIKIIYLVFFVSFGFLFLTYVGFLRGQSFDDISTGIESIQKRSDLLAGDDDFDMLYTIKTGNFAVPMETFPRIISSSGDNYYFGLGYYSFSSLLNIVPIFLWQARPIPLSSWYMNEFYGKTNLNEGRQFFLLTAPYMDFGPFGVIIFAIIFGFFLTKLNFLYINASRNTLIVTLISLFYGSLMNLISNDFFGFLVAFIKGYAFPILIVFIVDKSLKMVARI